ncbi:MAG: DUF4369 domain-containing protein [Bacteroidia bacterium]|nr:DUF4369 domain-containing protein [Bacteroidia bacterium]
MKTKTLIFILLIIFATSCNQTKEHIITGTFSDPQTEEWIYLQKMFSEEIIIDSARITDGKFTFKGEASGIPEAYALSYHPSKATGVLYPIFVESGKTDILIDSKDWEMKSVVTGGKVNNEFREHQKQRIENFITEIGDLNNRLKNENITDEERSNTNSRIKELWRKAEEFDVKYIKQHPDSPVSAYLLARIFYNLSLQETDQFLNVFSDSVKQTDAYRW